MAHRAAAHTKATSTSATAIRAGTESRSRDGEIVGEG
jgi:hypothetical protein